MMSAIIASFIAWWKNATLLQAFGAFAVVWVITMLIMLLRARWIGKKTARQMCVKAMIQEDSDGATCEIIVQNDDKAAEDLKVILNEWMPPIRRYSAPPDIEGQLVSQLAALINPPPPLSASLPLPKPPIQLKVKHGDGKTINPGDKLEFSLLRFSCAGSEPVIEIFGRDAVFSPVLADSSGYGFVIEVSSKVHSLSKWPFSLSVSRIMGHHRLTVKPIEK